MVCDVNEGDPGNLGGKGTFHQRLGRMGEGQVECLGEECPVEGTVSVKAPRWDLRDRKAACVAGVGMGRGVSVTPGNEGGEA